jgi:hypothetical protein
VRKPGFSWTLCGVSIPAGEPLTRVLMGNLA